MKPVSDPDPGESLYKKIIMFHYRSPLHRKVLLNPTLESQQVNRSCGDRVKLQFELDTDGKVLDVAYQGEGCSICIASASILCDQVKNLNLQEAASLALDLAAMLEIPDTENAQFYFEKIKTIKGEDSALLALWSIRDFGARVPCALLSWKILPNLLEKTAP